MKILLSLLLILSSNVFAYTGNSLSWQKLVLEEKIQQKVSTSLAPLLNDNQFRVEVEVEVNEPGTPNFGQNSATGPRVSDLNISESRGDYIAFSKVGLEVPVLEKFMDDDRAKLVNLYRFNETFDLFKNIASIKLYVSLSDQLAPDLVEIVKKVVSNSKLSVAGIKPSVNFETIKLEWVDPKIKEEQEAKKAEREAAKTEEEKEPKIWQKDWYEWASRWGNAVGLIFVSLTIAVIALLLFKQWREFMEKFIQSSKAKTENEQDNKDEKGDSDPGQVMATAPELSPEEIMKTEQDFERFVTCLQLHPMDACNLVRGWLADTNVKAKMALRAVAQQLGEEHMNLILKSLTEEQRNKWKTHLDERIVGPALIEANTFVAQEVLGALLVPSKILDGELQNLLMSLNTSNAILFFQKFEDFVGVTLNLLGPNIVNKILTEASSQESEIWLEAGARFDGSTTNDYSQLKQALTDFNKEIAPNPFASRIAQMIPLASADKENVLYRALAKAGGRSELLTIAKVHFPSDLILKLPTVFIKEVMQSYPMAKRIELIFSLDDAKRGVLLEACAPVNTPAREMLDMELENIERDSARSSTIKKNSILIWDSYVKFVRENLVKAPQYASEAEDLIQEWEGQFQQRLNVISGGKVA
jgi:hypothetical protein